MLVRSLSWGSANISWSVVIEELLYAIENMGHEVCFISTNGYNGMKYWNTKKAVDQDLFQRNLLRSNKQFDLDLTYTVPQNFPQRFLKNSKKKMAIYAYESSIMPDHWKRFYGLVDYMLPPSQYVADMMIRNGCPEEKVVVVPHGVDLDVFNPSVEPLKIKTEKSFKFLCVAEPHYRKQLDKLLQVYCERFTSKDDVCLILKTKVFGPNDEIKGFEMNLKPVIAKLKKIHGDRMPEIKIVSKRLNNIASLYTACDAFVLMSASEGWGVPYLEALAVGMPVIAPRFGGQLQFLNDKNAILTKCGKRKALPQEQYWKPHPKATVGNPDPEDFGNKMVDLVDNKEKYVTLLREPALKTAIELTWKNAASQILDLAK